VWAKQISAAYTGLFAAQGSPYTGRVEG